MIYLYYQRTCFVSGKNPKDKPYLFCLKECKNRYYLKGYINKNDWWKQLFIEEE